VRLAPPSCWASVSTDKLDVALNVVSHCIADSDKREAQ
jgi:hypothetical protein